MRTSNPLRQAAEAVPREDGGFLRCDRGDALYVTNALSRRAAYEQAGFDVREEGGLLRLTPGAALRERLAGWLRGVPEAVYMAPLRSRAAEREDLLLLCEGVKRWELGRDPAAIRTYEKSVRQRAAACLRTGQGGGTLGDCARLLSLLTGEGEMG